MNQSPIAHFKSLLALGVITDEQYQRATTHERLLRVTAIESDADALFRSAMCGVVTEQDLEELEARRRSRVVLVGLLLALQVSGCAARSRMGTAVVQQSGALPCFGIENTPATRAGDPLLNAITVYALSDSGSARVWSFIAEPTAPSLPFLPGKCMAYGKTPAGVKTLVPAVALVPGVVYVVSINARLNDASDPTSAYRGEFCLVGRGASGPRVVQIEYDVNAGKSRRDQCLTDAPKP